MGVTEQSILYMQNAYPEVSITKQKQAVTFKGRFVIEARHDDFEIHIAPQLRIEFPMDYPKTLPLTFDVENIITYDHKCENGSLCLATEIDMIAKLHESKNISDYIENFLIPYFISYEYWKKYQTDIFGDRSHGIFGLFESLRDFLDLPNETEENLYFLICWAAKLKKFRKLIAKPYQHFYLQKYSAKIAKLRTLGIMFLRKQYQIITKNL